MVANAPAEDDDDEAAVLSQVERQFKIFYSSLQQQEVPDWVSLSAAYQNPVLNRYHALAFLASRPNLTPEYESAIAYKMIQDIVIDARMQRGQIPKTVNYHFDALSSMFQQTEIAQDIRFALSDSLLTLNMMAPEVYTLSLNRMVQHYSQFATKDPVLAARLFYDMRNMAPNEDSLCVLIETGLNHLYSYAQSHPAQTAKLTSETLGKLDKDRTSNPLYTEFALVTDNKNPFKQQCVVKLPQHEGHVILAQDECSHVADYIHRKDVDRWHRDVVHGISYEMTRAPSIFDYYKPSDELDLT